MFLGLLTVLPLVPLVMLASISKPTVDLELSVVRNELV